MTKPFDQPRIELFDLAVNRARLYAAALRLPLPDEARLAKRLQPWYLKTRFAYRVPLDEVVAALSRCPGDGHHWRGGRNGRWHAGPPQRP